MKPSDCNNRNRKLITFKKGIERLNLVTLLNKILEVDPDIQVIGIMKTIEELKVLGLKK